MGGIRGLIQGAGDDYNQRILMAIHLIIHCDESLQRVKKSTVLTIAAYQQFLKAVHLITDRYSWRNIIRYNNLHHCCLSTISQSSTSHHSPQPITAAGETASATAIFTVTTDQRLLREIHLSSFPILPDLSPSLHLIKKFHRLFHGFS